MQSNKQFTIRAFKIQDYNDAISLWKSIEGLGLNESDTPEAITFFLEQNPDFSAVALNKDGEIIGTILCGHNGRAGSIYHLAVASSFRRLGIANQLVEYAFSKLAAVNIPRCNIFVYSENDTGNKYWRDNGWDDPTTWKVMQKFV
ncbi:GNAT family N-acetyltransferase [Leucothrix sargassi]|nr:GNAT family N-acetyltransferase [Leucothrix sargassi]